MSLLRFLKRHSRLVGIVLIALLLPVAVTAVRGIFLIRAFEKRPTVESATLFDARGGVLATLGKRRGAYVSIDDVPQTLKDAVIAIEDSRFYRHRGIDIVGIGRAIIVNIRERRRAQGASTITQQLAKNLFLSPEKTFLRKFQEAIFALLLEARYSKERILELYLNQTYFGEGAYGVEEAARTYFDKTASQLTLDESALLAGLLRAPSRLSPYNDATEAVERRDLVLARMEELGYLSARDRTEASRAPLRLAAQRGGQAPYFVDYVRGWLVDRFGARQVFDGGLRVSTTLDPQIQAAAENALAEAQGAVVVLGTGDGHIKAMVGGRDYVESQFNRAVQSRRQPGSAFKPFVFAAALERGWQMNDLVEDIPRPYGEYAPANFNDEYWGSVTMKQALVESLNNGSVWLLRQIGVNAAFEMAERLGITTLMPADRHLALALGGLSRGVSPIEMAAAYAPFANGGVRYPPTGVLQVRDAQGNLLYRHRPSPRPVLSEEVAYFITDMLQAAVWRGTGTAANIGRPQAGKTGTTDNRVNAWFVGYTPELVAAVYVGNDDRTPLPGGGGTVAAPIWGRMMVDALKERPVTSFAVPPFVVTGVSIDIFTGLVANENCAFREFDSFVRGRQPVGLSPCARGIAQRGGPYIARGPIAPPQSETAEPDRSAPQASRRSAGSTPTGRPQAAQETDRPGPRLERAFDALRRFEAKQAEPEQVKPEQAEPKRPDPSDLDSPSPPPPPDRVTQDNSQRRDPPNAVRFTVE